MIERSSRLIDYYRELNFRENQVLDSPHSQEPVVLLPLEVMVRPLELRFKYHFEGDRPTNRLEKVVRLFIFEDLGMADEGSRSTSFLTSSD